jgi:hypothetical protein
LGERVADHGYSSPQSYAAPMNRVKHHLAEESDELLKKWFQIINVGSRHISFPLRKQHDGLNALVPRVWRPIKSIFSDPLTLADAHSVPDSDLVAAKLIYPNRWGETYALKPNPNHRWYFKYA